MKKIFLVLILSFFLFPISFARAEDDLGRTHDEGLIGGGGGSGFAVEIPVNGNAIVNVDTSLSEINDDSSEPYVTFVQRERGGRGPIPNTIKILKKEFRSGGIFDLSSRREGNLLCGSADVWVNLLLNSSGTSDYQRKAKVTFTLTSVDAGTDHDRLHLIGSFNYSYRAYPRGVDDVTQTAVFSQGGGDFSVCSTDWTLADGGSSGSAPGTALRPPTDLLGTPPLHDLKTALENSEETKKDDPPRPVQGVNVEAVTVKGGEGLRCSLGANFSSTFDLGSVAVILFGLAASRICRRRG